MGQAAAASGMSLANVGLQMFGAYESSRAEKSADEYKAAELERAADYGHLKATQTNAQLTRNINFTLGNIDAVRAAAHTDPSSPTGAAVRDYTEQQMTEQKNIRIANIEQQAREDEAGAAYERFAGSQALLVGDINMISAGLAGGAGAIKSLPGSPAIPNYADPSNP